MMPEKSFWKTAALLLGIVSFLKGVRLPSRWAASEALPNYDYGWIKRGFFGATLGHGLHLQQYARFAQVSLALLAIFFALLIRFTLRSKVLDQLETGELVAVFSSSFAVTYLAHLIGYPDIVLGIFTLVLLAIRNVPLRFAAALPVCACALMIHESFLLALFPVILFSLVLDGMRLPDLRSRKRVGTMCVALALLAVAVTVRLAYVRPMTARQVDSMTRQLAGRADFPLRTDYFEVYTRSTADNLAIMAGHFIHGLQFKFIFLQALIIFLPVMLILLIGIERTVHGEFQGGARRLVMSAASVAAFSPQLLNLVGWDTPRWNTLTCESEFLVLLLLCRNRTAAPVVFSAASRHAAVLVIALSMAAGETLMDFVPTNSYPFMDSAYKMVLALKAHRLWTPPDR